MTLSDKTAVIYGASGSMGQAFAEAFAAAGATVLLTGRNPDALEAVVAGITAKGGKAEIAIVDALSATSIQRHLAQVKQLDISFNAIGWKDTQDVPLIDMHPEDFLRPIHIAIETQFLTATAAARTMLKQGSGVILTLTATPGGVAYPLTGGFGVACCAVESFSKNLASELGPGGVRVVNIRSGGSPDTRVFREAIELGGEQGKRAIQRLEGDTMLKQLPMMADIANTGVFLASDLARKITGVTVDVTAGTTTGLNHSTEMMKFGA
ncbi:SDR family oxidoreductase [Chitinophaga horti]|uniref:SDR family oxidoreductase n=1 Tax=Chitinophaga horti TaxID=2920382 RepID=A0ABY6JAX0_9BACT|nr:SDR family oxidoreductase [Chitinophaga horti]UYQ95522.1 SDR family oxidoreductase [Chitinophaga horti]